ncbi:MAG TPA: metalloregulator ArsR/SmtB family transcription factor [Acidimicrobiales bacterium]|nr:metalloregulator ArsR/SmtB family transcription factor [Acidimicrobiales bacterium]
MSRRKSKVDDETYDRVFKALAHGTRRRILDRLRNQPQTTGELCAAFPELDRCTTMQHLGVLERAGLVIVQRKGRERWNHLDVLPIKLIHDRWIGDYARSSVELLATLKADMESSST